VQREPKMEDCLNSLSEKHLTGSMKIKITQQGHGKSQGVFELSTLGFVNTSILK
jgi:hypothetical protein